MIVTIDAAFSLIDPSCTTDRGHRHSDGKSEICIWIGTGRSTADESTAGSKHGKLIQAATDIPSEENADHDEPPDAKDQSDEKGLQVVEGLPLTQVNPRSETIQAELDTELHLDNAGTSGRQSMGAAALDESMCAAASDDLPVPSSPVKQDFAYMEEFRSNDELNKYDKVINLFLNKLTNHQEYSNNLSGLARYFDDQLPALTRFLKNRFGLPGSNWNDVVSLVTQFLDEQEAYRSSRFTLAAVFIHIQELRSTPACDLRDSDRHLVEKLFSPKSSKAKRRRKAN